MGQALKAYPMVAVLAILVAVLLFLDTFAPEVLLRKTEFEGIDSLRTYSFVLRGEARETARCWRMETEQRVVLYIHRDSSRSVPQAGDTLVARTRIRRGERVGDFDYGLYLRRNGFIGTAYVWKYELKSNPNDCPLSFQQRLYSRLAASGLSGDELATTGALVLGYKEDLDPSLRHRFQASGAAHVLAVSGLHTGILYGVLVWLLTAGGRWRPRYENRAGRRILGGTVIAFMWGYAWLTGLTPSVVRAVLMISLVELGRMFDRYSPTLNTIAAAAVLILVVRPLDLWSLSFQLSFSATAAIVVLAQGAEKYFHTRAWSNRRYGRLCSWGAGTVIVSVAAQLGTLGITMHTFGQVSTYFLLTNLIVLPIVTLLVPAGLVTVLLGGTWLGRLAGTVSGVLAWGMNHAVGWIEQLPMSTIPCSVPAGMAWLYYVLLVLFAVVWVKKE